MTMVCMSSMPVSATPCRVRDQDDAAAARGDLLHVRDGLLEELVARRDDDDGHRLVDQRDGAVLQLAGRIGLGVDVGDFLQLQRAFQGHRDSWCRGRDRARPSPWRGRARRPRRPPRPSAPRPSGRAPRSVRATALRPRVGRQRAAGQAGGDGEAGQHGELAGEGLGRGDADLRARPVSAPRRRSRGRSRRSAR